MASNINTWVTVGLMLASNPTDGALNRGRGLSTAVLARECDRPQPHGGKSQDRTKRSYKWWRGDVARTQFGISEQQSSELERIFQQTLPILKAKKADIDREEQVLSRLLAEANTMNESAVLQAVERVEAMRRSLSRTFTMMQYYMYRTLTAAQRAKVHAYHEHEAQRPGDALPSRLL